MVKRVDVAVYKAFRDAKDGTWKAGAQNLGLKEGGVDYALDQYNRSLITPEMEAKLNEAKQAIIDGKLEVKSYYSTQKQ
jgi:basic membrane protein A